MLDKPDLHPGRWYVFLAWRRTRFNWVEGCIAMALRLLLYHSKVSREYLFYYCEEGSCAVYDTVDTSRLGQAVYN